MTPLDANRWQFSMRHLFVAMTAMGLLMFVAINSAVVAAMGIFVTMLCAWLFVKLRASGDPHILAPATALLGIVLFWFSAFDSTLGLVECGACGHEHREHQYRLLGIPLFTQRTNIVEGLRGLIASDLGQPCSHTFAIDPIDRRWGFVVKEYVTFGSSAAQMVPDADWYTSEMRARVRLWASTKPETIKALQHRLLATDDWAVLFEIQEMLREEVELDATSSK
ncbi:hypothetical protein NA78x_004860 [Anatilimnocola sp. NA78]|uniref:hypothetical protein n=1 Tax=Anatilimnocola sp. NA78 TaxID=3415683 RepID=UPI003CE51F37